MIPFRFRKMIFDIGAETEMINRVRVKLNPRDVKLLTGFAHALLGRVEAQLEVPMSRERD